MKNFLQYFTVMQSATYPQYKIINTQYFKDTYIYNF